MKTCNVMDFGACADGKSNDSDAIHQAIAACSAAGGGTVHVPAGSYLTGPIRLASNLNFHTAAGAAIVFSRDFDDYPLIPLRREGWEMVSCTPPIYGRDLENVSITGHGEFDGGGDAWRPVKKFKMTESQWEALLASGGVVDDAGLIWWPTAAAMAGEKPVSKLLEEGGHGQQLERFSPYRDCLRPVLLCLDRCRNVLIDGPTFRNPPMWTLNPVLCDHVTVRNVTVENPWHASNGDGLNPDSCRHVLIEHCRFSTGDDCIAINSGRDEDGRRIGRPCEDVVIRHCRMQRGHGGVVIGSGMSGGVRNVRVHDCTFEGTDIGLRFKTARGRGGTVEDIEIRDITMTDISGEAIRFNMRYMKEDTAPAPVSEKTPRFRDFKLSNITCNRAQAAVTMRGLPEMPIENVTLENIDITADQGVLIEDARDITFSGGQVTAKQAPVLHSSNVRNLRLDNFTQRLQQEQGG